MASIPKKLTIFRKADGEDTINGIIVPADNKETKAYKEKYKRYHSSKGLPDLDIDNVGRTGFRIIGNVSNRRQTDFKIEHPEGFTFSIDSENMMDLIRTNDIIDVEFKNPLFFNDKGKLVNQESNIYNDMIEKNENEKEKRRLNKEIQPGTYFQDAAYESNPNKGMYHYLGRFHCLGLSGSYGTDLQHKSQLLHVMYNCSDKELYIMSTFRFSIIEKQARDMVSIFPDLKGQDMVDKLNTVLNERGVGISTDNNRVPYVFALKPFKLEQLVFTKSDEPLIASSSRWSPMKSVVMFEMNGNICVLHRLYHTSTQGYRGQTNGYNITYTVLGEHSSTCTNVGLSQCDFKYGTVELKR